MRDRDNARTEGARMLKPEETKDARRLVVQVGRIGRSKSARDATFLEFTYNGEPRYIWLTGDGVAELRRRVGPTKLLTGAARVPLILKRIRNPRTRELVDRYRVDTDATRWQELDR